MLAQLDYLTFSQWHLYVIIALGTTWIFDGFEVSMLALVSDQLMIHFQKTQSEIGLLASIYLLGCCIGAFFFSCFAYKYGRKDLFNVTLLIYFLSVISVFFSQTYTQLALARFFTGIGVGGEYTAIFAAIDELIPAYIRGRVDIIVDGTWALGGLFAAIFSIILYLISNSNNLWRIQFLLGALGAIPIFLMRRNIPESPRWLIFKGKYDEAKRVIEFIKFCCEKNKYVNCTDSEQDSVISIQRPFNQFLSQILFVLFWKYPSRFYLGFTLMSVQAFFYQGIYYTFAMQLQQYYQVQRQNVYLLMVPLTLAGFSGTIIFGQYFDIIGRRIMIGSTYIASGIIITFIGLFFAKIGLYLYVFLFFFLFLIASPGASSAHLTVSEIFPCEMRSQAMAIFFGIGLGVGGIISPYFFGKLIETQKLEIGCYVAGGLMIYAGIVGFIFGVDAENKPLEQISQFD